MSFAVRRAATDLGDACVRRGAGAWGAGLSGREEYAKGWDNVSVVGEEEGAVMWSVEMTGLVDIPLVKDLPLLVSTEIQRCVNENQCSGTEGDGASGDWGFLELICKK